MRRREKERVGHPADTVVVLLKHIQGIVIELHPHKAGTVAVTLDSSLERELGFDSLSRVELIQRLERAFEVQLPEQLLATAETPRDLLRAIQDTRPTVASVYNTGTPYVGLEATASAPVQAQTLVDVLDWHVQMHPQRPHVHLYGNAEQEDLITYKALYTGAVAIAAGLQARHLQPGQMVALMLPTSQNFLESFMGILLAGGVPVPLYPPTRPSQVEAHLHRQSGILTNARSVVLITEPETQALAKQLHDQVAELRHVVTPQDLAAISGTYTRPALQAQDTALVQYTSGSTGTPKGVVLTHANLLANIRVAFQALRATSEDVFVSWLPLYHDMGLIGAWLGSLYWGFLLALMSPLAFLARPARWLWAIHRHRGTLTVAPNFAYELCVQRINERRLEGLDLSSWRLALNGAEPVSPETISRFSKRYARYGFRPEAMLPVYGLAENALALTFPPLERKPRLDRIKREPFIRSGQAVPANEDDPSALCFVSCGPALPGNEIRLLDATGYEVPERQEGRLEFRSASATSGYLHNPEATRPLFHDDWLDSGDLAYIAEGEVYLTGRVKDIILRAGRNLYPHELEAAVGDLPGIRKGCVAVFGSPDPISRTERLVVLAETRVTDPERQASLRHQIDNLSVDLLGTPADAVVLAPPHTVLKTSSGKIRRAACRELYARNHMGQPQTVVWWRLIRLALAGIWPELRRLRHATGQVLFAAYAWMLFVLLAPFVWFAAVLLPRQRWRQQAVQRLVRLALRLAGIPLLVQGLEHLPQHRPCVLVVNHTSYLDALVLVAVLPTGLRYVAKQALAEPFLSRLPLRRLGVKFVERSEAQRSIEDTARVVRAVQQGQSMVFFPEGTFGRAPGLQPFRMGAFVVAAQTGVPVVPLAVHGTRSILRADQWFLRRGAVRLIMSPPIMHTGTTWDAAVALRDTARRQILQACGEPDLARDLQGREAPPMT